MHLDLLNCVNCFSCIDRDKKLRIIHGFILNLYRFLISQKHPREKQQQLQEEQHLKPANRLVIQNDTVDKNYEKS